MLVRPLSVFKALVPSLVLCAAVTARATDEFDMYVSDVAILQIKEIQKELKITEGQRASMNNHAKWLNEQGIEIDKLVVDRKLSPENANKTMQALLATLKKKVLGELSDAQVKRLREITLQRDGLLPLMDQKVSEKIRMTKAQLKKIREAYVTNDVRSKALQEKAFAPIRQKYDRMKPKNETERQQLLAQANKELDAAKAVLAPELEKLGKEFEGLVNRTLSKGQLDAFKALKGRPFVPPKKDGG